MTISSRSFQKALTEMRFHIRWESDMRLFYLLISISICFIYLKRIVRGAVLRRMTGRLRGTVCSRESRSPLGVRLQQPLIWDISFVRMTTRIDFPPEQNGAIRGRHSTYCSHVLGANVRKLSFPIFINAMIPISQLSITIVLFMDCLLSPDFNLTMRTNMRFSLMVPFLIHARQYAIIASFVIVAILTPTPDIFNQFLMAIPVIILYEIGVLAVRFFGTLRSSSNRSSPLKQFNTLIFN